MALLSVFRGKKEIRPTISQNISPSLPDISRHNDDLDIPAPSIEAEKQVPQNQEILFPEIPKEETGPAPEIPNIESPEEIPETLPELEEPASAKESKELPMPEIFESEKPRSNPIFVNVEDYQVILDELNAAKSRLAVFSNSPAKLNEIKILKENNYERWRNLLEDIERKLLYIDKNIFGGD